MKRSILSIGLTLAGAAFVAGCDVATYPVAVVGPAETVYRGTATATLLEGGWFQVVGGNNTCRGQFTPTSAGGSVTFPVSCSNGLTGIGSATYTSGIEGGGHITMQDGTRWQFIFGRRALQV